VAELRALARQQLQAGAREQALGTATAGLKLTPDDRELRRVLDELATEARATTQRAREVASSAGAGTTSRTFQEGLSKERQAARLERQNQRAGSLKAYWEATDLFTKAGAQARAANTNAAGSTAPASPSTAAPAPAPSPPPTSATPVEPPQPEPQKPPVTPAPPAPQPAQPAVAPSNPAVQAPPPQPTPADRGPNDEAAIRATLRAYAQAFSALDVAAVQKVFPGVDARGLAQSFAQMRQQRVEIVVNQISVSGSTATVTSEVQSHFEPKAGRATDTTVNATFRLQKAGGGWIIAARR
jgi:ketosteroid isomerase-like protein